MTKNTEPMESILGHPLESGQAALWPIGQAGFIILGKGVVVAIDPYLSDSVAKVAPDFARASSVPIEPEGLCVDLLVVTHDHLDHLDPETILRYPHKATTTFIAPRFSCGKLIALGVPEKRIMRVDVGEHVSVRGVRIDGIYAVPTGPDVLDTCGYRLELPGGRTVYHTSDTAWSGLLSRSVPHAEVLLVCINGKFGNLNVDEAVQLTQAVRPKIVVPMHYDVMARNTADPVTFARSLHSRMPDCRPCILKMMEPFVW